MKLNRKNRKAFTIVELVIVVGVIGILSAILIPTFANLTSKAQDSALKSDLAAVYASYVADAADGYVGDTTSGTKLAMYNQGEVALSKESNKYYLFRDGAWLITPKTSTEVDGIDELNAPESLEVSYNGYTVYRVVAAKA